MSGSVSPAQDHASENTSTAALQAASASQNGVQILTPTDGVDFSLYLNTLTKEVRNKWYASMPEAALKGEKGEAIVLFRIHSNGEADDVLVERNSGNDALDQAAIQAIRNASPFHPLPIAFKGPSIALRFIFYYNMRPSAVDNGWRNWADCEVRCRTRLHRKGSRSSRLECALAFILAQISM